MVPPPRSPARAHIRRLLGVLRLSLLVLAVEVVGGLPSHSLALLSDGGHVFTDAAGISLALLAIWVGSRPPSTLRTFGYLRLEILAAVANAVLLFGVAAFILYEAWRRLSAPPQVASLPRRVLPALHGSSWPGWPWWNPRVTWTSPRGVSSPSAPDFDLALACTPTARSATDYASGPTTRLLGE